MVKSCVYFTHKVNRTGCLQLHTCTYGKTTPLKHYYISVYYLALFYIVELFICCFHFILNFFDKLLQPCHYSVCIAFLEEKLQFNTSAEKVA